MSREISTTTLHDHLSLAYRTPRNGSNRQTWKRYWRVAALNECTRGRAVIIGNDTMLEFTSDGQWMLSALQSTGENAARISSSPVTRTIAKTLITFEIGVRGCWDSAEDGETLDQFVGEVMAVMQRLRGRSVKQRSATTVAQAQA